MLVSNATSSPPRPGPLPCSASSVEPLAGRERVFVKAAPVLSLTALLAVLAPLPARAQVPGATSVTQSSSPAPLQPTASAGPTSPFLGGVPAGVATKEPLKLTIIDAILRALDHNLGVLTAEDALGRAQGARKIALSQLLPNVSGRVSETRQVINLQAFGFGSPGGPSFPGLPVIVGPFNVFDARAFVTQTVFDLEAQNNARSEAHALDSARLSRQSARDFVIHVAGTVYIDALAASARVDAARAQLETAEALYQQALSLRQGGIIAGVDVLRAQVQLSVQQQRSTASVNDFEKVKLSLARVVGLPLGQAFVIDPNLPDVPVPTASVDDLIDLAVKTRPDYQAALARVHAAESTRAAIAGSAMPSVHVSGDVGPIGLSVSDAKNTYSVAASLNVPIFNGNRTHGRLLQADADLRTRQNEAADMKAGIDYEIRAAFLDLQATSEQLRVATTARDLAAQQLTQARDRFAAGVVSNVEVIQAQEAVALATEQFISSQYG